MEDYQPDKREAFVRFLREDCLYLDVKPIPGDRYACIYPLVFTHAIITVRLGDMIGLSDRWCYHTLEDARAAMAAWDGAPNTEPEGWHRHPHSGRRREGGKREMEIVEP